MADIAVTYNAQQDKTETIERFRESSPQMFRYKEIYSFQTGFMDRIVFLRIWVPIDTETIPLVNGLVELISGHVINMTFSAATRAGPCSRA